MIQEIKNISNLILNSLSENFSKIITNINLLKNEKEKLWNIYKNNKNLSSDYPKIYFHDNILEGIKNEYTVKQKKKFKNEIKNEIKNKFITSILDSNRKKDDEIFKLKLENNNFKSEIQKLNNQIKSDDSKIKIITNEIENLKKNMELEKINSKNEINSKIENLIIKNKNEIEILNKIIENENKKNNIFFENIKQINEENNLRFKKIEEKAQSTIQELTEEITKIKEENKILKKNDELKDNKIKTLNEKIKENERKIKNSECQIEIIFKIKKNTEKILKETINNIDKLKNKLSLNNKRQKLNEKDKDEEDEGNKENKLKLELFSQKNYARVGLINICNTCYMNSALQILKNIPIFTYNIYISSLNNSDKFIISLKNLLINLCKPNNSPIAPNEFKAYLGSENKLFSGNNQFDSTIFYVALLTIINKKLNKNIRIKVFKSSLRSGKKIIYLIINLLFFIFFIYFM